MIKYEELVGIAFDHGKDDCYGIIRRFYDINYGIQLTNYARPDSWWEHGLDLYTQNFAAEGFRVQDIDLSQVKIGDLFLIAIGSFKATHAAIYVGDGMILHHFYGRLSTVEAYRGVWRNKTIAIIRHKDVVAETETEKTVDLMTLLPENRRRKYKEILDASVANPSGQV
jgi:cell wall-associated NlpC family hydrolase